MKRARYLLPILLSAVILSGCTIKGRFWEDWGQNSQGEEIVESSVTEAVEPAKKEVNVEQTTAKASPSEWMDIDELRDYLPGHNARCTIYQWIRYDGFPYYQNAKSYYFRRGEVDDWLIRNGRKR